MDPNPDDVERRHLDTTALADRCPRLWGAVRPALDPIPEPDLNLHGARLPPRDAASADRYSSPIAKITRTDK